MEVKNIMNNSVESLYKIYNALNEKYYGGNLPEVIITIQDSKGKYYGWFASERWKSVNSSSNEIVHEINISPEHLSRPIENICATLNHEMVHLYCFLNDIEDTSNNGRYHNKKFKKEAENRGLIITKANGIGWSNTEPSENFIDFVKSICIDNPFPYFRITESKLGNTASSNSAKKYVCPSCGAKLRGKSGLSIKCMGCDEYFVEE